MLIRNELFRRFIAHFLILVCLEAMLNIFAQRVVWGASIILKGLLCVSPKPAFNAKFTFNRPRFKEVRVENYKLIKA